MKRILVTGCAGYIGRHVMQHLTRRGEHAVVLDNLDFIVESALAWVQKIADPETPR